MGDGYKQPFTITEIVTNLIIEIGELVGRIAEKENLSVNPKLRRDNRIKTIYSSLAIEQNTMSLEQVSDVIDGKRVLAPPKDIREVKNAYEAYEELQKMDPYSMKDLFVWLKTSKQHPLMKSCVFHYEFEFIHPFEDGNGRTGRLWHSLILQKWKPFFAWLPIETLIQEYQDEYYRALNQSNTDGESTVFIEFMLRIIRDSLHEMVQNQEKGKNVGQNVGQNVG